MIRAILVAVVLATTPAVAEEDARIAQVQAYLTSLPPSTTTFIQKDPDGTLRSGWMALAPPSRMRIEYEPPSTQILVADGTFLVFHDPEAGQVSHISLASTPLRALLDGDFGDESTSGIRVLSIEEGEDEILIQVAAYDEQGEEFPVRLALVFANDPFRLEGWWVLDVQKRVTEVQLNGFEPADLEDPSFFQLTPDMRGRGDVWRGPWKNRRVRPSARGG